MYAEAEKRERTNAMGKLLEAEHDGRGKERKEESARVLFTDETREDGLRPEEADAGSLRLDAIKAEIYE